MVPYYTVFKLGGDNSTVCEWPVDGLQKGIVTILQDFHGAPPQVSCQALHQSFIAPKTETSKNNNLTFLDAPENDLRLEPSTCQSDSPGFVFKA